MLRLLACLLLLLSPTPALAREPPTAPYPSHERTLFLQHFDGSPLPDLARGSATPTAGPGDRHFIEGRFGQALLFTRDRRALTFPAAGNYDHRPGTMQTQGGVQEKIRFVIARGNFNSARTRVTVKDVWADLMDGQLGLKKDISHWKYDEWRHMAVLWDTSTARLLLDGVCVARGEFPGFLEAAPAFDVGANAIVALDELRISDSPPVLVF